MSVSSTTEVYEAELIDANSVNPFATPSAQTEPDSIPNISAGIGRASEQQIRAVIQSMVASEVSYLCLWVAWLSSMAWTSSSSAVLLVVATLIAWACFARLVLSHGEFDLTSLAMILSFPVPLFGLIIFFGARTQACRFLIWNGYKPGVLGASPDHAEIVAMNADPNYRPSAWYDRNGVKRKTVLSLNQGLTAILVLLGIASCIVVALT